MSSTLTLKPCPFCGSAAEFGYVDDKNSPDWGGHYVQCTNPSCCGCLGLRFACKDDPKPDLAVAWNRRVDAARNGDAQGDAG